MPAKRAKSKTSNPRAKAAKVKRKTKVRAKTKAAVSKPALSKTAVKRTKARPSTKPKLSHINRHGQAHMVDVSAKAQTERVAIAEGKVIMRTDTLDMVIKGNALKGDVLGAARLAGIMAAKRTHGLIPLCHPLPITKVEIDINPEHALPGFLVQATVKVTGQTGVEMEALTAVSIACLTIYDMVKAVERGMRIEGIRVLEKSGGKSGHYKAEI
ncbi:MAG: cyclic pyranopterin monophosphate synthase MoaC [Bradyrhizobium sp. 35-63-5]|nr:MAG: cyclic pyranopterin monophosphate synthase MoaC [Bradyrhizobium sp. 35-63-5]